MSKLTKAQAKAHKAAVDLLSNDTLSEDDKWFVLENWQESAEHINSIAGAFFTPVGLARDFTIEVSGLRILDLCAGIGCLSFQYAQKCLWDRSKPEIVCVEKNPAYATVGRKILPEARWIEGDAFDLPSDIGRFDCVIRNPPFGATARGQKGGPRYTGNKFEYHVIDVASDIASYGVFIIPQGAAPFRYSGQPSYEQTCGDDGYKAFVSQTGIELGHSCGIDTSYHLKDWRGVAPATEIVVVDFEEARARRAPVQGSLLLEAAE